MKLKQKITTRTITSVAILSAVSAVLMFLEFSVPLVPAFLKFDFSDFPALLASFAISPVAGVIVELIKNVLHLPFSHTAGVGELANFLVGSALVLPAGLVYHFVRTKKGAVIGSAVGAVSASIVCLPVNLYITYPFYAATLFGGSMEGILDLYRIILPSVEKLIEALLIFNLPFTFVKGMICLCFTFATYKYLSPILKGKKIKKEMSKSAQ